MTHCSHREKISKSCLLIFPPYGHSAVLFYGIYLLNPKRPGSYLISQDSLGTEVNCGMTIHTNFFFKYLIWCFKSSSFPDDFRVQVLLGALCHVWPLRSGCFPGDRSRWKTLCLTLGRTGKRERTPLPGRDLPTFKGHFPVSAQIHLLPCPLP